MLLSSAIMFGQNNVFPGIAVIVLIYGCTSVGAIKCFQCNSYKSNGCFPLNRTKFHSKPCPSEFDACAFFRQVRGFPLFLFSLLSSFSFILLQSSLSAPSVSSSSSLVPGFSSSENFQSFFPFNSFFL